MGERPILFSAPMVRAILAGRKTQTRRVAKIGDWPERGVVGSFSPAPEEYAPEIFGAMFSNSRGAETLVPCPYGAPGDRLWVKETWRPKASARAVGWEITYAADGEVLFANLERVSHTWRCPKAAATGNVTPLFMPRWASRITLEVTGVRVERVQDISEEDARAEGAAHRIAPGGDLAGAFALPGEEAVQINYRAHFRDLWESINGAGSWARNPWVWVVSFKKEQSNG